MIIFVLFSRYEDPKLVHKRDIMKQDQCEQMGITLLIVPFWWNSTLESIAATLHQIRPDLPLSEDMLNGSIIPSEMPKQKASAGNQSIISDPVVEYFPKQEVEVQRNTDFQGWHGENSIHFL